MPCAFWSGSTGRRRGVAFPPSSLTGPGIPHRPPRKVSRLEGSRPGGSEKPLACLLRRFGFQLRDREGLSVYPPVLLRSPEPQCRGSADAELASPGRAGPGVPGREPRLVRPSPRGGRAPAAASQPPAVGRGGRGGRAPSGRQEVNGKRRRLPPTPQCRSRLLQQQQ